MEEDFLSYDTFRLLCVERIVLKPSLIWARINDWAHINGKTCAKHLTSKRCVCVCECCPVRQSLFLCPDWLRDSRCSTMNNCSLPHQSLSTEWITHEELRGTEIQISLHPFLSSSLINVDKCTMDKCTVDKRTSRKSLHVKGLEKSPHFNIEIQQCKESQTQKGYRCLSSDAPTPKTPHLIEMSRSEGKYKNKLDWY